ncbi:MAG: efflux RND transporter periplasmic adaptor subunit [Bacillota bacterium]|nr:efflux RND transporter periplasmic adaptor subunit [Bacillota bacterium]
MKKRIIAGSIVVILMVAGIVFYNSYKSSALESEGATNYSYANVTKGDIKIDIMADGQIDIMIRDYSFERSGDVSTIDVSIGQEVVKGEILGSLNTEEIQNDLYEANLNLQTLLISKEKNSDVYLNNVLNYEYQLNELKINYEVLKSKFEDMEMLSDIYPLKDIEEAKRDYEQAVNDYENYKEVNRPISNQEADSIAIEKATNTIKKIELEIENSTIYALFDGRVIDINAVNGENVSTSKVIFKVEDEGNINVTANLQEIDILSIVENQKAYIELEAMVGREFEAKVTNINRDPIIDNNGIVNYQVTLELLEDDRDIMDGMTVTTTFIILEKLDVIKIPNKAVKKVEAGQVVNVVTGENTAEQRKIITGLTDGRNVEILEGLSVGEKLVYEN